MANETISKRHLLPITLNTNTYRKNSEADSASEKYLILTPTQLLIPIHPQDGGNHSNMDETPNPSFLILLVFIFPPLTIYFSRIPGRDRRRDPQYNVFWTFLLWFPGVIHAMLYTTDWWNHVNSREILYFASPKTVGVFSQKEYGEINCSRYAHCSRRRKAPTPTGLPWAHIHRNLRNHSPHLLVNTALLLAFLRYSRRL